MHYILRIYATFCMICVRNRQLGLIYPAGCWQSMQNVCFCMLGWFLCYFSSHEWLHWFSWKLMVLWAKCPYNQKFMRITLEMSVLEKYSLSHGLKNEFIMAVNSIFTFICLLFCRKKHINVDLRMEIQPVTRMKDVFECNLYKSLCGPVPQCYSKWWTLQISNQTVQKFRLKPLFFFKDLPDNSR